MNRKSFLQKIGLVSSAAALFGIAHTTPIHAAVVDNVPVSAKDVSYKNTNVDTSLTELNNGLQDIDVRYQSSTGVPEWSPRGADAWRPFSSGYESLYFQGNNLTISNSTGVHVYNSGLYNDIEEHSECLGYNSTKSWYAKKTGFYGLTNNSQSQGVYVWLNLNSGDSIPTAYVTAWQWGDNRWGSGVFYSPTDPTQ